MITKDNIGKLFEYCIADMVARTPECRRGPKFLRGKSKERRQLNAFLRFPVVLHCGAGRTLRKEINILFESKYRSTTSLGIEVIDEFIGKMDDIGAHVGFVIGSSKFTKPARNRATSRGVFVVSIEEDLPGWAESIEGEGSWKLVSKALVSQEIGQSPFEMKRILCQASEYLMFAGQNLYTILKKTAAEDNYKLICNWINSASPEVQRRVEVLVCSLHDNPFVDAWGGMFIDPRRFRNHLTESIKSLQEWKKSPEARDGKLVIRTTKVVPLSVTFVDPDRDNGQVIMTPIVNDARSRSRPAFVVTKDAVRRRNKVVEYYWRNYKKLFAGAQAL